MNVKKMMIIVITLFLILTGLNLNGVVLGKLRVKVLDSRGEPVRGVNISIQSLRVSTNLYKITTKKNGIAVQNGLLNHQFSVTVEKEGYRTMKKIIRIPAGQTESEEFTMLTNQEAIQRSMADDPHAQAVNAFNKAAEFINRKKFQDAMEPLKQAIALDEGIYQAHFYLGYVYYELGKLEESLPPLLKSVELKPDYADAFRILSAACEKLGKKAESVRYTKKAQEFGGKTAVDVYNEGLRAFNTRDTDNAVKLFNECIKMDGSYADAYYRLGICYLGKGDYEKAIANLKTYIRLKPDGADVKSAKEMIDSLK